MHLILPLAVDGTVFQLDVSIILGIVSRAREDDRFGLAVQLSGAQTGACARVHARAGARAAA